MYRTIIGVVVPAKWNSIEVVSAVSIQGTDEVEYEVVDGAHFKALLALLGKRIRAEGEVEILGSGNARMDVQVFNLLPPE